MYYIYIYTLTMMYAFILLPSMLELIMLIYRNRSTKLWASGCGPALGIRSDWGKYGIA
jgi:hypothetical protein